MKKLSVKLDKCTGCKRCEQACIGEHSASKNYIGALFEAVGQPTRIFVETATDERAVPIVCRHCTEALCVTACMAGCMQKDPQTGIVSNMGHEQKCVGCWMCIMACPYGVISAFDDSGNRQSNRFSVAVKCDFCPDRDTPACVAACPDEAIAVIDG